MDETNYNFKQLDITPEEFYGNDNSIYLRCTYKPDVRGFKVVIFNQIKQEAVNEDLIFMATLCRGLAEAALCYPADMYELGKTAQEEDIQQMKEELTPDQISLLDSEPKGSA